MRYQLIKAHRAQLYAIRNTKTNMKTEWDFSVNICFISSKCCIMFDKKQLIEILMEAETIKQLRLKCAPFLI